MDYTVKKYSNYQELLDDYWEQQFLNADIKPLNNLDKQSDIICKKEGHLWTSDIPFGIDDCVCTRCFKFSTPLGVGRVKIEAREYLLNIIKHCHTFHYNYRKLNRVTVTGADDSINPKCLREISEEFPFVEWGILLSKKRQGTTRFPSELWIDQLQSDAKLDRNKCMKLSGHLCGQYVRDLCLGKTLFDNWLDNKKLLFNRFQLNFHGEMHIINDYDMFAKALCGLGGKLILQMDGVNDSILYNLIVNKYNIETSPLFDSSGGAGILSSDYSKSISNTYCGYAGGLTPYNILEQLRKICAIYDNNKIWIDVESGVRSNNDSLFDLHKVWKFLSIVNKHVAK